MEPAAELSSSLFNGENIAKILREVGPIVDCVLLRAQETNDNHDPSNPTVKQLPQLKAELGLRSKAQNPDDNLNDADTKEAKVSSGGTLNHEDNVRSLNNDSKKNDNDYHNNSENDNTTNNDSTETLETNDIKLNEVIRPVLANLIDQIKIDTTPKKSMVYKILGGNFTFLGQYEDEGIVVIVRDANEMDDLPLNPHQLQPPLHQHEVRGDILLMRVAATPDSKDHQHQTDETDDIVINNDEFFLDYTKEEYINFAQRTDIIFIEKTVDEGAEEEEEEEEEDIIDDSDDNDEEFAISSDEEDFDEGDEECQIGLMNMILAQILKRFRDENGRGPNTEELLTMRAGLAEKLGIDQSVVDGVSTDLSDGGLNKTESSESTTMNATSETGSGKDLGSLRKKRKLTEASDADTAESCNKEKRVKFASQNDIRIMTDDDSDDNHEISHEKAYGLEVPCSAIATSIE